MVFGFRHKHEAALTTKLTAMARTRADARVLPVCSDDVLHEHQDELQHHDASQTVADAPAAAASPHKSRLVWNRSRVRQLQRREWTEKVVLLWDALQIYALVWQLAQPWPWPARWLRATRWVNAFNFDAFSFRATGAALGATSQPFSLWGEMNYYWLYALLWTALPSCSWLALCAADAYWRRSGRADCLLATTRLELALLQLLQRLYLPIGLAALRLVNCDANGAVSVDPYSTGTCWSSPHALSVAGITVGLGGSFLLGLPWLLHVRICAYLAHPSADKHERFVRAKELEFALKTSETFLELHVPLHASFVRRAVEAPVETCALKLTLLLVFALLRSPFPSRANEALQGALTVATIAAMAARRALRTTFRLRSTARLARLVDGALVSNGVFVLLSASGMRSALTVATTLTRCLTVVNTTWVILIGFSLAQSVHESIARARGNSVAATCCWTVDNDNDNDLTAPGAATAAHDTVVPEHVETIKCAKAALLNAQLATPSMRSTEELGVVLQRLRECYDDAVRRDHLLADQLSELLLCADELYVDAVASNPFHRLPFPERELASLSRALQQRANSHVLLSSRSRRVLDKMRVASAWTLAPVLPLSPRSLSPEATDARQSMREHEVDAFTDKLLHGRALAALVDNSARGIDSLVKQPKAAHI